MCGGSERLMMLNTKAVADGGDWLSGAATPDASSGIQAWSKPAEQIGTAWMLRKGSRVAACQFWSHPSGGAVRLVVDTEWMLDEALDGGLNLIDVAHEWHAQFTAEGWK
jgi:hypothetical protein